MECLFCKIVSGEIPAFKIYEDDATFAFLDINPAAPGHTLVVPKRHARDLFEIDEQSLRAVAETVKKIAAKIHAALGTDVTVLQNNGRAAGQAIDHLHVHIIPRRANDRLPFVHMGPRATDEALAGMHKHLTSAHEPAIASVRNDSTDRVRSAMAEWDKL